MKKTAFHHNPTKSFKGAGVGKSRALSRPDGQNLSQTTRTFLGIHSKPILQKKGER